MRFKKEKILFPSHSFQTRFSTFKVSLCTGAIYNPDTCEFFQNGNSSWCALFLVQTQQCLLLADHGVAAQSRVEEIGTVLDRHGSPSSSGPSVVMSGS